MRRAPKANSKSSKRKKFNQDTYLEFDILSEHTLLAHIQANYDTNEILVDQFTDDPLERPFHKRRVTPDDILDFLETRCFPETSFNRKQLLKDLGLTRYSPLDIVRKTHGLLLDDHVWVRFAGEKLDYETIKLRS